LYKQFNPKTSIVQSPGYYLKKFFKAYNLVGILFFGSIGLTDAPVVGATKGPRDASSGCVLIGRSGTFYSGGVDATGLLLRVVSGSGAWLLGETPWAGLTNKLHRTQRSWPGQGLLLLTKLGVS